jgi:hypothetical protein
MLTHCNPIPRAAHSVQRRALRDAFLLACSNADNRGGTVQLLNSVNPSHSLKAAW